MTIGQAGVLEIVRQEVTPSMIEAGLLALREFEPSSLVTANQVALLFARMRAQQQRDFCSALPEHAPKPHKPKGGKKKSGGSRRPPT